MGMMIEDCIKGLLINKEDDTYVLGNETIDFVIDTMRKYQKIEEIVSNYGFDTSWLCLKKIREVMEGGNNNTDGKKLC